MHLPDRSTHPVVVEQESHWWRFLCCCFAGIVGFRMFLVEKFGTSIAYGDDLDGIARRILRPWEDGTLSWSALFAAHNGDHRIVATRLWEILWYELNGSWDPKLVMLVKVPIFAAAATIFIHILAGGLPRRRFLAGSVLAVLFAFPFAFANMLWAFQSQFDFFLLLAALGWLLLLRGRVIAALVIAAAAILTLGSGPLIAASYVPFFVIGWLEKRESLQRTALCVAASVAVVVIGLMSPSREAPPHTGTLAEKTATLFRVYAWPHSNLLSIVERLPETERYIPAKALRFPSAEGSWLLRAADQMHQHPAVVIAFNFACALLVAAPLLVVAWEVYRRRVPWSAAIGPLALSGFAFLMIVATAIARANQVTVAPRYLDHVALAGFSSLVCCFILAALHPSRRRWVAAWGGIMGTAYLATMAITLAQMSRGTSQQSLEVLQRYFATTPHNHAALLEGQAFRRFIVSDDPTQFMAELDEAGLDRVLPRSVTAPGAPLGRAARIATPLAKAGPIVVVMAALAGIWVVRTSRRRTEFGLPGAIPLGSSQAGTGV